MSGRTILVGALAMICGVTAALGVTKYLDQPEVEQVKAVEMVKIPVATVKVERGDTIEETMIAVREWPKEFAPQGVVMTKEELLGKIAQSPLFPEEPFLDAKIGESERFSGFVAEGMRAYTIMTPNDASLVAGLITPGDHVDVLFTDRQTEKEFTGGGSTTPLLQNIEVMAVGKDLSEKDGRTKESKDMRSVTLAVTLDMATKLALAQQLGTLHLALRSAQDASTAEAGAITLKELMHTMYPALALQDVELEEVVEPAPVVEAPMPQVRDRNEIMVRTVRGFVPSEMVMAVSADGMKRRRPDTEEKRVEIPIPDLAF